MNSNPQDIPQNAPVTPQPLQSIEPLVLPTRIEKFWLKLKSTAAIHAVAIAVGIGGGGLTGYATQKSSRMLTGFDPVVNSEEIKKLENKKVPYQDSVNEAERKRKQGMWDKIKETLGKSKDAILNPEEFIKNTEMYRTVYREYLLGKERFDAATFWVPGMLMLLMLWKFTSGMLTKLRGDIVRKKIDKALADKINQLVANQNQINAVINDMQTIITAVRNGSPLTLEQATQVQEGMRELEAALPTPEEMETIMAEEQMPNEVEPLAVPFEDAQPQVHDSEEPQPPVSVPAPTQPPAPEGESQLEPKSRFITTWK